MFLLKKKNNTALSSVDDKRIKSIHSIKRDGYKMRKDLV